MTLDGSLLLLVHPHERLLHRVACAVEVLQDALGVLQERTLKPLKSGLNPRCLLFSSRCATASVVSFSFTRYHAVPSSMPP
jgi:hypothetical protein